MRVRLRLVVLVDDPVARVAGGPCGDAEGRDAEVMADGPQRLAAVVQLVDLVEVGDRVTTHAPSLAQAGMSIGLL